jgi:uncharacterized protein
MTPDTVDAVAGFAGRQLRRADQAALSLLLFGGEPLTNVDACARLLDRLSRIGPLRAGIVTNGTLLTPGVADRLRTLGLRWAQITVDGPPDQHDAVRTTRAGRATFDRIVDLAAAVQASMDLRYTVRVNVTATVLPRLDALVDLLAGRLQPRRTTLRLAAVCGAGPSPAAWAAALVDGYGLARSRGFRLPQPRLSWCVFCTQPDGRRGAVVNADGTLYSCWESVGRPGYAVGSVHTGYVDHAPAAWVRCAGGHGVTAADDAVAAGVLDLLWTGVHVHGQPSSGYRPGAGLEPAPRA